MASVCTFCSTGKQVTISLRKLPHEVCEAATQAAYWQQLVQHSRISISSHGKYVPVELEPICSDEDEPRLHLIIQSQHERDTEELDDVCATIHSDLISFEYRDRPIYESSHQQVILYGSLFNSLPSHVFETERHLLGQRNCNIEKIRNTLGCSIDVDKSTPQRYRFTIRHEKRSVMDLAVIQIQALVRQAQDQYIIAFATKIGRSLVGPVKRMETTASSQNPYGFTPFQPFNKRTRQDYEEEPLISGQTIIDSDEIDDDITSDEIWYDTGVLDTNSTVTTSPAGDNHDHVLFHASPLSDRFCVMKLGH